MGNLKDMYALQKQAKKIKQELKNTHVEAEIEGIKVIVDGEQEIVEIIISDDAYANKKKLTGNLKKALNKAMKRAQQFAAERMKGVMGDMGMGGMFGQ